MPMFSDLSNSIKPPEYHDPSEARARLLTLGHLVQQQQMGAQQMQLGQLHLDQGKRDAADEAAYRGVVMKAAGGGSPDAGGGQPGAALTTNDQNVGEIVTNLRRLGLHKQADDILDHSNKQAQARATAFKETAQGNSAQATAIEKQHEVASQALRAIAKQPTPELRAAAYAQQQARLIKDGHMEDAAAVAYPGDDWLNQSIDAMTKVGDELAMRKEQREATESAAKLPGLQADSIAKSRQNLAVQLAAAPTKEAYAELLDAAPHGIAAAFPAAASWDAKATRAAVLRLGTTPDQTLTIEGQDATRAQTGAHNAVTEQQGASRLRYEGQRVGLEGQRVRIERDRFNATLGSGLDANGKPLTGEELKQAAEADPMAKQIAEYKIKPPTSRNGVPPAIMRKVIALNPNYDQNDYDARHKTSVEYSAGGKIGQALTSADTALAHLNTVSVAGAAMKNGDIKKLNELANALGVQIGNTPRSTYDTIVSMVAPEISKAVIGESGSREDRAKMEHNYDSSYGDAAREQAIGAAAGLLGARVQKSLHSYESQMGRPHSWNLSPDSQAVLNRYGGGGAAPAQGAPLPTSLSAADVGKVYTNRAGKKIKITAVNPANATQFQSAEVQ